MVTSFEFLATWLRARFDEERGASLVEYALLVRADRGGLHRSDHAARWQRCVEVQHRRQLDQQLIQPTIA